MLGWAAQQLHYSPTNCRTLRKNFTKPISQPDTPDCKSKKYKKFAKLQPGNYVPSPIYRETHLLANLGWVDFDVGCSTLCLVLPGLMGNCQNWLSSWARWWNIPNQSQLNPGSTGDGSLCTKDLILSFQLTFRFGKR